jgi:RNA-directed DNA polymerase
MGGLRCLLAKLKLRINESKSAVARPWGRKFLGYSFWVAKGREVKRRIASKALAAMKQRVRALTGRSRGRSMLTVVAELRSYLLGWKQYFHLADTPGLFRGLDAWIRHRLNLRALQLKQWKNESTVYRELRARGLSEGRAVTVARNTKSWWRTSAMDIGIALRVSHFDNLGVPRLAG